jgi:hypothetical protein
MNVMVKKPFLIINKKEKKRREVWYKSLGSIESAIHV